MLDLRSISNESTEYKWYPLARNRYKTHKPQVRLMLSTEEPGADTQQVIVTLIVIDFIWGINRTEFGPIVDRSEGPAWGFILYKYSPYGLVFIRYRAKCWRGYAF